MPFQMTGGQTMTRERRVAGSCLNPAPGIDERKARFHMALLRAYGGGSVRERNRGGRALRPEAR